MEWFARRTRTLPEVCVSFAAEPSQNGRCVLFHNHPLIWRHMRSLHHKLCAAVLLPLALATTSAQAATWAASSPATSSCSASNLFATWSFGSYGFNNDVWAPCSGTA